MNERFSFLLRMIQEEGARLHNSFCRNQAEITTYKKGANDLVTSLDIRTEKNIITRIHEAFPDDIVHAEEQGRSPTTRTPYSWWIDPIDGTSNFAHTYPFFCLSIALCHEAEIVAGAVYDPTRSELFYALKGRGAFLNNKPLAAIRDVPLSESLLITGFPYRSPDNADKINEAILLFESLQVQCQALRRDGAAALDLCYVACGRANGFFESTLNPWDVAAGMLIAEEVGAVNLNYSGQLTNIQEGELITAPPMLARELTESVLKIRNLKK